MDLTYQPLRSFDAAPARSGALFLHVFGVLLLGYALLGRTVAYVGMPPLYIGEVVLALGLVSALRTPALRRVMTTSPFIFLALLMGLALVRTVPYFVTHGLDAARDAMQLGYGLFAFIMAALLLEQPERLRDIVRRYRRFVLVMLALVWVAYLVSKLFEESIPFLPWTDSARLVEVKAGDLMVHLAAITVFLMVGLMRLRPLAVLALAFTVGIVIVSSRAGMVAYGLAVGTAWLLRPATAKPGRIAAGFVLVLALGLAAGPVVAVNSGERDVSVEQLWQNVTSVFVESGTDTLDGSTEWRKAWWSRIVDYTITGPHFWTGRGFGINLAKVDGFSVSEDESLRSPHNGHLTILARMGVPGFALWTLLQLVWLASMLHAWFRARLAQQHTWTGLFALLIAYWLAMTVNASFDVYLEGPMGGIWFWTVWGIGLAAAQLHRTHPALFEDPDAESEITPPVRRHRWTWAPQTSERPASSSASPAWSWPRESSTPSV
ncbi:MAG: O-antigen ligase family protein [Rhodothermaceae bacterium]|nr:O-antigen ligase family protein [Rhodothermaceae bacterium]